MAFVVKYRGLDVSVETLDQLDQLADRVSPNGSERKARQPRKVTTVEPVQGRTSVRKMVIGLVGKQRRMLSTLAEGKQTDAELRQKLNLESNKALAGVLSGISKAMKRDGLLVRIIDKTAFRSSGGERKYTYALNPTVKEEVREALEAKGRA